MVGMARPTALMECGKLVSVTITRALLVALVNLSLTGCCGLNGVNARAPTPGAVAGDGLGPARSQDRSRRRTPHKVSFIEPAELVSDSSEEEFGERARFDKINRALVICRGC